MSEYRPHLLQFVTEFFLPSHDLKQCWLFRQSYPYKHVLMISFIQISELVFQEKNALEDVVCKMAAILFIPQNVLRRGQHVHTNIFNDFFIDISRQISQIILNVRKRKNAVLHVKHDIVIFPWMTEPNLNDFSMISFSFLQISRAFLEIQLFSMILKQICISMICQEVWEPCDSFGILYRTRQHRSVQNFETIGHFELRDKLLTNEMWDVS